MENQMEIDLRKVKAFDLLRKINQAMSAAKGMQQELQRIEGEINELEQANAEPEPAT